MYARSLPPLQRPAPTIFASFVPARSWLLFDLAQHDGNISGSKGPRGTGGNRDISEARFILCIIPKILVLFLFFTSRILQAGILQTVTNSKYYHRPVCRKKVCKLDLTLLQTAFYKLVFYKMVSNHWFTSGS